MNSNNNSSNYKGPITLIIIVFLILMSVTSFVKRCTDPEYIRECRLNDIEEARRDSIEENKNYDDWIIESISQWDQNTYFVYVRKQGTGNIEKVEVGEASARKAVLGQLFKSINYAAPVQKVAPPKAAVSDTCNLNNKTVE